jgi:hypothetical protein
VLLGDGVGLDCGFGGIGYGRDLCIAGWSWRFHPRICAGGVGSLGGVGGSTLGAGTGGVSCEVVGTEGATLGSGGAGVVGANVTRARRSIGAKLGRAGGVSWLAVGDCHLGEDVGEVAEGYTAARWLSLVGERGDAGDGFKNAWIRSLASAVAVSADKAVGMVTLDKNHTAVSAMRSAMVSAIHTR